MATLTKNITESMITEPAPLIPLVSCLQFSHNNYRKQRLSAASLPDSIQVFSKTEHSHLQSSKSKHFHDRCLIIIPLSGNGRVTVNALTFSLKPGLTLFVPPYHFHHYSEVSESNICWLFLTFKNEDIFLIDTPLPTVGRCTPIFWTDLAQLVHLYRNSVTAESTLQLTCRLVLLVTQILNTSAYGSHNANGQNENLLMQIHQIVIENLKSPLDMHGFASRLGISESHLRSRFRSITGMSLGNFQRTLRLHHAAILLNNGSSVTEVAARCGWESPFSFSRSFTSFWGVSPKKFAMQKQKEQNPAESKKMATKKKGLK